MNTGGETGRVNQKTRTRLAIVDACRDIIRSGAPVTMPNVAQAAHVSEPTAYRYFPDLTSLITAVLAGMWPTPADALAPVANSADPVERVAFACEFLLRGVLSYQGAIRAMISATITHPELAATRPGVRFGLLNQALDPIADAIPLTTGQLVQLKQDLSAVISAEALFTLTDLTGLTPNEAIASLIRSATTVTRAACTTPQTSGGSHHQHEPTPG